MKIVELERQHVPAVALLHKKYIDRGFMSSLGTAFLEQLYDSMMTSDNAYCLVAEEDGELHGFISGTYELRSFYKDFIRTKLLRVSLMLLPRLIKPSVFRKVVESFIYPSKQGNMPGAELMSIVVSEKFRGKGVSENLFNNLLAEFKQRNVKKFKVTVGSNLQAANRFYQKMGGMLHAEIEVHDTEISRIYIWEI
jgi:ribosomal protein S18 acetylase RimI-like enzyme